MVRRPLGVLWVGRCRTGLLLIALATVVVGEPTDRPPMAARPMLVVAGRSPQF